MTKKRILAALLASMMILSSMSACGSATDTPETPGSTAPSAPVVSEPGKAPEQDEEQIFNSYSGSIIVGLNPIIDSSAPDNSAHNMICEPLVRKVAMPNNSMECQPAAAEKWEVSPDGMTYTFHLRKDAKWSDGVDFTAKDFEYTFKMMATPEVASTTAWLFDGVIENFGEALYSEGKTPDEIGVKALDDYTLEIKLTHPASYLLELLGSTFPIRQDKYEEWGDSYGSSVDKVICSGRSWWKAGIRTLNLLL